MRTRLVGVAALGLAFGVGPAVACPCSDDAGGASGLVRRDERYAVALVATSRHGLGRFDAFGHYSPFAETEGEWSEELLLRAGFRLPRRLEWTGELGYAAYRFHAPGIVEGRTGLGDALLHARYVVWDEGMPHERWPLPALSIAGLLRAPLGTSSVSRAPSYGSGGAQLGLGAWELGGGVDITRVLVPELELMLGGEAAYRFEDHALGPGPGPGPGAARARRLGPRADVVLGVRLVPSAWLSGSLALRGRMNGDVTLNGRRLEGTAERLWSVVAGLGVYEPESGLRSSVTLSVDAPLGIGSTRAAALGVALGYGRK